MPVKYTVKKVEDRWITAGDAAAAAGVTKARILNLARDGVLTSRKASVPGTKFVVVEIWQRSLDAWLIERATKRLAAFTIHVPGDAQEEVLNYLRGKGVRVEKRYKSRKRAEPFAELLEPEQDSIDLDAALDERSDWDDAMFDDDGPMPLDFVSDDEIARWEQARNDALDDDE